MRWPTRPVLCAVVTLWLAPGAALAQPSTPSQPPAEPAATAPSGGASNFWFAAGGAFVARRGDCTTCEHDFPFKQGGGVLVDVGHRLNDRMDVAAELFWTPTESESGRDRANLTHLDAIAQFRPWASQGFFLKGGAGMAFVRNWAEVTGGDAIRSKAFSVVIGGGWAFRPADRFGFQLFATQHAAALGDLETSAGEFPDVLANFWSVGVTLVFR